MAAGRGWNAGMALPCGWVVLTASLERESGHIPRRLQPSFFPPLVKPANIRTLACKTHLFSLTLLKCIEIDQYLSETAQFRRRSSSSQITAANRAHRFVWSQELRETSTREVKKLQEPSPVNEYRSIRPQSREL